MAPCGGGAGFLVELHPIPISPLTLHKKVVPTGHLTSPHYASDLSINPLSPLSLLSPDGTQRPPRCLSGVPGLKGSRRPGASTASTYLSPSVRDREFPPTAENSARKTVCSPARPGMATQKQWGHPSVSSQPCVPVRTHRHMHAHTHLLHSQTRPCHNLWCAQRSLLTQSHSEQNPASQPAGAPLHQRPLLHHIPPSFLFLSAALQGPWDLSSLTKNGTQTPQ